MTIDPNVEWLRRNIFARKPVDDDRSIGDSLFSVEMPLPPGFGKEGGIDAENGRATCVFFPLDFDFVLQLAESDDEGNGENEGAGNIPGNRTELRSYGLLFSFGIALPCVVLEPIYAMKALEIKNAALIMVFLATPIVNSLRIAEGKYQVVLVFVFCLFYGTIFSHLISAFGFTPFPAQRSLRNYVIYFSCTPCIVDFDPISGEPKRASPYFLGKRLATLARDFAISGVLLSILKPYNYEFFDVSRELYSMDHNLGDLFSWQHLLNNYLVAVLISTFVSQGTIGVSLVTNIFYGLQTSEVMLNPMFKSKSPADFWGRRWNLSVHKGLKNGVYKPTRKQTSSKVMAVCATFVVSGIIHEYVNFVMFGERITAIDGVVIPYRFEWKQMLFFGWNGILISLEYCIGHWALFNWTSQNLPQIVVTALVIGSCLPLVHLFTGDYIQHGYFDDLYIVEPIIHCRRV
eukprot:jgi/Psemu1/221861/e_gw1.1164.26.1